MMRRFLVDANLPVALARQLTTVNFDCVHVFDLADWDRGLATSTPGQSGQPGSPHYGDLLPLWAEQKYFPMAFSRKKVDEVSKNVLWLGPAAK